MPPRTIMGIDPDKPLKAVYSPSERKIGCVIIAAFAGADRETNMIFPDWFTNQPEDMIGVTLTAQQWWDLSRVPADERPGPDDFKRISVP